jgi:hypothetical protein
LLATALAALLSFALENVQMFLPTRIASNIDLLSNSAGAALGALAGVLLSLWNNPLTDLRRQVLRAGTLGDAGLVIIALWLVIQFQPSPIAFGSGNLRDVFGITPMFMHSSQAYLLAEAAVVALAVITIGLAISLMMQTRRYTVHLMLATLLLTAMAKSIAAISISRASNWLQWLTPGVAAGLLAGALVLAALVWLGPSTRAVLAMISVASGIALINLMPDNPYQAPPPFMSGLQPTHLANFGSIVRLLSQCWPFATLLLLFALAREGPPRPAR